MPKSKSPASGKVNEKFPPPTMPEMDAELEILIKTKCGFWFPGKTTFAEMRYDLFEDELREVAAFSAKRARERAIRECYVAACACVFSYEGSTCNADFAIRKVFNGEDWTEGIDQKLIAEYTDDAKYL